MASSFWASPQLIAAADSKIDYNRQIKPILSDNCYYCHGPDAAHRKAKLRLDDENNAKLDREGGAVILPGSSAKSLLTARIETKDEEDLMPPPKSHKVLTPQQIKLLKEWIDQGAQWGKHWSFSELHKPEIPKSGGFSRFQIRNPIDSFVGQRLRKEGLNSAPPADNNTLIRRVTLDLTGLPPTPQEVEDFIRDKSPRAYEKVVDRLLASAAYGERMAWDWMEVSRYADSNGYQSDGERAMWPWRDWVIRAFNENLPYAQFTLWQIAGDLIPSATQDQKLATAFLRNHPINGEGGRIPEENRVEYVMDMAETTGTAWLGLTMTCTRCHDHKFDPLTRRDYFGLYAFFNQTPVTGGGGDPQTKPVLDFGTPLQKSKLAEHDKLVATAAEQLLESEKTIFLRDEGKKVSESQAATNFSKELKEILDRLPKDRDNFKLGVLEKEFEKNHPDYLSLISTLKKSRDERDQFAKTIPKVMVMEDMAEPRKTQILDRGLYNQPKDEVTPSIPQVLAAFTGRNGLTADFKASNPDPEAGGRARRSARAVLGNQGQTRRARSDAPYLESHGEAPTNRLGLAQWLVAAENPLTARVTVNRIWQMFFGIGLVKTSEDFGSQGELPTHPELLDWLAFDFRNSGWNMKRLVKTIVTSSVYRQSSRRTPEQHQHDPANRLLSRGPRFRMPSWMLRDQALAVSGLMVERVGGPSVKPYQPDGVWEEATFGEKKYIQDHGEALYRRSLYIFWRRIVGPTVLFDTTSRMTCNVKPIRNNTPLHAFTTLNDVTFVEAARSLAERTMGKAEKPPERARAAFYRVLSRWPEEGELAILLENYLKAKERFLHHPEEAKKLITVGESKSNSSGDEIERAAWTATCLAILNLDETLTKE